MLRIDELSVMLKNGSPGTGDAVLSNINLTLEPGELLGIAGASGAGKTTLAKSLLGLLSSATHAQSGQVTFHGTGLRGDFLRAMLGRKIVYIPQSAAALNPLFPVSAQLKRLARRKGISSADKISAAISKALTMVRLKPEILKLYPYQLSTGMARRVFLAAAFLEQPDLIIADEPTTGLDDEVGAEIMAFFRQLADQGCASLIISHDLKALQLVTDRLAILLTGKIVELSGREDMNSPFQLCHPYSVALLNSLPGNLFSAPTDKQADNRTENSSPCPFYRYCPINCPAPETMPEARSFNSTEMVLCHAPIN